MFIGAVSVSLIPVGGAVEFRVRDTGAGIPPEDLPHVSERFHRVPSAKSRSHEGTGIGLALTSELARIHGGEVTVTSGVGEGTGFRVRIPLGTARLPPERIGSGCVATSTKVAAASLVEESMRRLPKTCEVEVFAEITNLTHMVAAVNSVSPADRPRVLLADDNADMRDDLKRSLPERFGVRTVSNGRMALDAARISKPVSAVGIG